MSPTTGDRPSDHDELATWDAAYVLGALSVTDRRRFEAHLADCATCRTAVQELAPMPGLLGHLTPDEGEALLAEPRPEPDAMSEPRVEEADLDSLVRAARRRDQRRWARRIGLTAAATAAAAALVVAIALPRGDSTADPDVRIALSERMPAPLTAKMGLTEVAWGTRLEMECVYPEHGPGGPGPWRYALQVVSTSGVRSQVATWAGQRGTDAQIAAATALPLHEIRRVEVKSLKTGKVLLAASPA